MKNRKIYFFTIFILIALVITLFYCNKVKKDEIQTRLSVSINFPKENIVKPNLELETILKEDIPKGTLLNFAKKGELSIKPNIEATRGLFFSFAVMAKKVMAKKDKYIEILIILKRREKENIIKRYEYKCRRKENKKYYQVFSKEFCFLKDDEIIISVKGNGIIIVNKPLLYKVINKKKRKYVFAIALDTLRFDSIGTKRNGVSLTPAIDALKKDSVFFANTYTQSSWTLPSFTSFFTGLYEFNHQITRTTSLEKSKPFLVEQLRENFLTVNFNSGLWLKGKFGFSRGFDCFNVVSTPTDSYGGKKLFKKTIKFIENSRFPSLFMFLHTYQIHSPYSPPDKYIDELKLKVKTKSLDTYFYNKQYLNEFDKNLPDDMKKLYDAEILAFDDFFSNFINNLKKLGIYEQSMIVFFTDHGEEFYEHKAWAHAHSMYNEVIKAPLIIKFPNGQYSGKIIKKSTAIIDILPTILDFTHSYSKHSKKIDGLSLMPLVLDKTWKRKEIFSSTSITWLVKQIQPKFAIINDNYKIIYNFPFSEKNKAFFNRYGLPPKVDEIQVFDIQKDINEKKPLEGKEKDRVKKKYMVEIKKLRNKIFNGMHKKRKSNIHLNKAERKKLKSLGYLSE
jgi:arylsulfatase A-like enzyme